MSVGILGLGRGGVGILGELASDQNCTFFCETHYSHVYGESSVALAQLTNLLYGFFKKEVQLIKYLIISVTAQFHLHPSTSDIHWGAYTSLPDLIHGPKWPAAWMVCDSSRPKISLQWQGKFSDNLLVLTESLKSMSNNE